MGADVNRISLLMGDESRDGHGETESLVLDTNRTRKELEKAYKKGARKLGFDFELKAANEYGTRRLAKPVFEALKKLGWPVPEGFEKTRELDTDIYADIWIFLAKLGDPKLEVYVQTPDSVEELYIGGYALFGEEKD